MKKNLFFDNFTINFFENAFKKKGIIQKLIELLLLSSKNCMVYFQKKKKK